jgi:hypothetical protein
MSDNNIYDEIRKAQEEQALYIARVTGQADQIKKAYDDLIEKGKKAEIGEIREWGGKRFRKQANGKWLEVSEHGMTKKSVRE